jgi:hypothetical protein
LSWWETREIGGIPDPSRTLLQSGDGGNSGIVSSVKRFFADDRSKFSNGSGEACRTDYGSGEQSMA